jgi:AraC-like DNA-binding protein
LNFWRFWKWVNLTRRWRTSMGAGGMEPDWWGETQGLRYARVKGSVLNNWQWAVSSKETVWLWLNRKGDGLIWGERDRFLLKPGMYAMTGGDEAGTWSCIRRSGVHLLELVVISRDWLDRRLGSHAEELHPGLAKWMKSGGPVGFCGLMGVWERDLCDALERAAHSAGPGRLLAEAKVLEWSAARLFRTGPGRVNKDLHAIPGSQVARALQFLAANLDQALDLGALAKEVGSSPHHLSRKVSAETGLTLQRHLRRLRIGKACEELHSKRMNVTEVALEVGYQSLSHFAKAFREETGRTPSEWLAGKPGTDLSGGG